ncbi:hypothetical protein [Mucisphaera sp.]|uniref:hypothetical protein n=1 Tax=Mucisphaera sp. TaxID=2913024 RepID=UPI003D0C6C4C
MQKPGERIDEGQDLCPHCLRPVGKLDHFCPDCARPITAHAAIDPFGQVLTAGSVYRQASEGPARPMVVVGMWMLCLPMFFAFAAGPFGIAIGLVYLMILWRVTAHYLRQRQEEQRASEAGEPELPPELEEDLLTAEALSYELEGGDVRS